MMFKVVFAYALLRGILDALAGRANLEERLMSIAVGRAYRQIRQSVKAVQPAVIELGRAAHELALAFRWWHLRHPELWQPAHRIEEDV